MLKSQGGRVTWFASWNNLSSPPDSASSFIYVKTGSYTESCQFMFCTVTEKAAAGLPHTRHIHTEFSDEEAACSKRKGAEVNSLAAEHAISLGWCACISEYAAINHRFPRYQISLKIGKNLHLESKPQSISSEHGGSGSKRKKPRVV